MAELTEEQKKAIAEAIGAVSDKLSPQQYAIYVTGKGVVTCDNPRFKIERIG